MADARISDTNVRNEGNLRRATSDLYYATFHAICEALVEPIGLMPESLAFKEMYVSLYRQVDHGSAEKRCKAVAQSKDFSPEISRFAKHFVTMKNKREMADYHPLEKFMLTVVTNDLRNTLLRMEQFWGSEREERAAFASLVGLRQASKGGKS